MMVLSIHVFRGAVISRRFEKGASARGGHVPCTPAHTRAATRAMAADVASDTGATAKVAAEFRSWMQENKVSTEGVTTKPTETEGFGLFTEKAFRKNETLLAVPETLMMNYDNALLCDIGPKLEGLKPWLAVALFLLHERSLGAQSSWAPYLALLPAQLDLPLFWTEEELAELEGTQVLVSTEGYRQYVESEFQGLQEYVFGPNPDVFQSEVYNLESLMWAFGILRSRTFAPYESEAIALVPGLDLVNHNAKSLAGWQGKGGGGGIFGSNEKAGTLRSSCEIVQGEQVYMKYGEKTNSQLALDYGFVDDTDNSLVRALTCEKGWCTCVVRCQGAYLLSLGIPEDDPFFDDKADISELAGLGENFQFSLYGGRGEPDPEMLTYLRLIQLSGTDSFLLELLIPQGLQANHSRRYQALFRDRAWQLICNPVSQENEGNVCECMISGCRDTLKGYPTSVTEDEGLLRSSNLSDRMRIAVTSRLSEKRALLSTMAYFEQLKERLPYMEYYQERRLKDLGLLDDNGQSTYDDFFKDGIA